MILILNRLGAAGLVAGGLCIVAAIGCKVWGARLASADDEVEREERAEEPDAAKPC